MAFTMEAIETPAVANPTGPKEFDLPVREFIGYDPKGKTDITGQPIVRETADPKQQTTTETVAEPTAPEESVRLSPKLSAIARREQQQRKREQDIVQREKSFAEKLAKAEKFEQLQAKIAAKDYSAADELGLSYDEFTQYLVDKNAKTDPAEQRYRTLEERQKALEKAQEEQTVKEYQQNQSLWKSEIAKVVSENPAFSTIKELGMEEAVLRHVNDSFDEDDIELTVEQAAQDIEDALFERAQKFASVSKIKQKVEEPPKALGAPKASTKTITQSMTTTSMKPSTKPFHMMSESEQWEEATRRVQAQRQQGR